MKYSRFEGLILVLGASVIVGGMLVASGGDPEPAEVVAQLLMVVVLAGALHWGRNGGFSAAILATLVYVYMRLPILTAEGFSDQMIVTMGTRVITYGVVGVVGGEISGRLKYLFARFDKSPLVDETTGVYNTRYAAGALRAGVAQWQRYTVPYSALTISVAPELLDQLRPLRRRAMLRQVASYIRNDIRLVDDLAHVGDGRFVAMLPHTPADGASVACDRLHRGVSDLLGVKETSVESAVYACDKNATALRNLADELDPPIIAPVAATQPVQQSASVDV